MSSEHARLDHLAARIDALETEQRHTLRTLGGVLADLATVESATDALATGQERTGSKLDRVIGSLDRVINGLVAAEMGLHMHADRINEIKQPDDSESGNTEPDEPTEPNSDREPPQIYYEIEYRTDPNTLWLVATDLLSPYATSQEAIARIPAVCDGIIAEFRIVKVTREVTVP
jgi:hypothetical protein